MRGSQKGPPPASFTAWLAKENDDWKPSFSKLASPEKPELRAVLAKEQAGACVYCGRRLNLIDNFHCHIEHFRPQKRFPRFELDFNNLFLSCGPENEKTKSITTCGPIKKDQFDEDSHVDPCDPTCTNLFKFAGSGEIKSQGSPEASTMISILNLNQSELKADRGELFDLIEKDALEAEMKSVLAAYCKRDSDGFEKSFAYAVSSYFLV